jgi:hypothetical protein
MRILSVWTSSYSVVSKTLHVGILVIVVFHLWAKTRHSATNFLITNPSWTPIEM